MLVHKGLANEICPMGLTHVVEATPFGGGLRAPGRQWQWPMWEGPCVLQQQWLLLELAAVGAEVAADTPGSSLAISLS